MELDSTALHPLASQAANFSSMLGDAARSSRAGDVARDPSLAEVRDKFDTFVGDVFYGEMIKAMRKTTDKPAYFHGGQAEEIFRGQYDQMLAEHLTEATAEQFTQPMFDLFMLSRSA